MERQTAEMIPMLKGGESKPLEFDSITSSSSFLPSLHQQKTFLDAIVTVPNHPTKHHETNSYPTLNHLKEKDSVTTNSTTTVAPTVTVTVTPIQPTTTTNNNNNMRTLGRRPNAHRHYKSLNNNNHDSPSLEQKTGPGRNPNTRDHHLLVVATSHVSSPPRNIKKKEYKSISTPKKANKTFGIKQSPFKHRGTQTQKRTKGTSQKHTPNNGQSSSDWNISHNPSMPNSERTVMLDHSSDGDGIELEYRDEIGLLELTHVMAYQGQEDGHEFLRKALIDHGHTVPVKWNVGLDINYHPVCDFHGRHRFMDACAAIGARRAPLEDLISNEEHVNHEGLSSNNVLKDQLELLRNYDAIVPETELLAREMMSLNRELHVIEMSMETSNNRSRLYRPCTSSCCFGSYWDLEEELEVDSDKSKKTGFRKLHRKGWNKSSMKENSIHSDQDLQKIRYLQDRRGICFTAAFADKTTRNQFGKSVNRTANFDEKTGGINQKLLHCKTEIFGLEKVGAISPSIRTISITKNDQGEVGFFVSHDDGKTHGGDNIPQRLKTRIQKESNSKQRSIRYLALGPRDSYFAELVSGETFWAIGKHDEQFFNIMQSSRVHRVAFGSFNDDSSWIVLTKDGTVAWRNIPLQLEKLLESRESGMAAPCEVSLGDAGTFFIRFMNGEINYCLPSFADEICRRIEDSGASISCISLHPEVMDAIIIRHTKLD